MLQSILQPLPQPYRVVLIEDDKKKLETMYDACWKDKKSTIELKGFRQGEVPRSVAEKKIGPEKLYKPVVDVLIKEGLEKIDVAFCELEDVAIDWQTDKSPLTIIIRGFLVPEVTDCNYQNIVSNFERLMVTDEEINTTLQRIAYSEAEEVEISSFEEIPEQDASKVNIVVNFMMDDVAEEKVLANQTEYRIDPTKTIFGFEPELKTKKVGDVFEFKTTLSEDFFNQEYVGKEVYYQIKVIKMYTLNLPEITDELAKKIGYEDLAHMRQEVTRDLEATKSQANEMLYRDHVMGLLVANTNASPIPVSLVKQELKMMLQSAVNNANKLQGTQLTPEDFLKSSGMSMEDWQAGQWTVAKKKLLGNMALKWIAKQEGLEATSEECEEALKEMFPEDLDIDTTKVNKESLREYVTLKKAQDFLIKSIQSKQQENKEDTDGQSSSSQGS